MTEQRGTDGKLYYNSGTYDSPTWTEVKNVRDLNIPDIFTESDVTTRGSGGVRQMAAGLREVSVEFQMLFDEDDADYQYFRAAYNARTKIDIAAMSGDITTNGSQGPRGYFQVFEFPNNQPLAEHQMIDVVLKPTRPANSDHAFEWLETGAT